MNNTFLKKTFYSLLIIFSITLFYSCDKCERNPCHCIEETNANFIMEEYSDWSPDFSYETDTILNGQYAIFKAESYGMSSYEWKVGTDTRVFTDSVFKLKFENIIGDIEIRLIVTNDIPTDCVTDDDGIDTIIKTLTIIHFDNWPFYGNYVGARSHLSEENHEISIRDHDNLGGIAIYDLQKGDETDDCTQEYLPARNLGAYYKRLLLNGTGYACRPKGIGYLSDDHKQVTLEYKVHQHQNNISFVGTRK